MSDTVKLSAQLAGDDQLNGLDALAEDMIQYPKTARVAVIWFDTQKVVSNTDEGTEVPYARIRRIEPIGLAEEMPAELQQIVEDAGERRTGKVPLPFDAVDGIEVQ